MKSLLKLSLISIFLLILPTPGNSAGEKSGKTVIFHYKETPAAFPNPMKGFRGGEYGTLNKVYIKWSDIEKDSTDGVEKLKEYSDKVFKAFPALNQKAIPRVFMAYPYEKQNKDSSLIEVRGGYYTVKYVASYFPKDLKALDYESPAFRERLKKMIIKMAEAWDHDPRVAYVEMGLIGFWGEQHSPIPSPEVQQIMGTLFKKYFTHKKIMIRYARDFPNFEFGYYWDSFAHFDESKQYNGMLRKGDYWKRQVIGGETAYDWGHYKTQPGASPDSSLLKPVHFNYIMDLIRILHANHVGWIANYSRKSPEVVKKAEEMQKIFGYRFVLEEAEYSKVVKPGGKLNITMKVRNVGSSPMYYNWPIQISLLDKNDKKVMWSGVIKDADISQWMPGDQWNTTMQKYEIPAPLNVVKAQLKLPGNLEKGEYILAVSVLDPSCNLPSLRFAIENYLKGGYHPLGRIGVGLKPDSFDLMNLKFDDLKEDRTLHY